MTNLINIDLTTLNAENLKKLAKEAKIPGWWTMKKAELLETLTLLQEEQKEEEHLTDADIQEMIQKTAEELGIELDTQEAPQEKKTKKVKAPRVEKNEENLVTLKELAAEFHMKGTKARRLLRNETAARPFGGNRWEWDKDLHKAELELARSILKAHTK